MSDTRRKSNHPPGQGPTAIAQHLRRVAKIYERASDQNDSDQTITIDWAPARPEASEPPRQHDPLVVPDTWPLLRNPKTPLTPRAGHFAAQSSTETETLFITLFGLTLDALASTMRRIEQQILSDRTVKTVFITDASDQSVFIRAGVTYEYFPADIYAGASQAEVFSRRFQRIWRKWRGTTLIDFSAQDHPARQTLDLAQYVHSAPVPKDRFDPRVPRPDPPAPAVIDIAALRAEGEASGLAAMADTFVLYRILGNDLPPRHETGQTLANLKFILDHEPELARCEKRWVLNRIVDQAQEGQIIDMLKAHGQDYLRIPFDLEDYGAVAWDLHGFPDLAFFLRAKYEKMLPYDQMRAQAHARRLKNNYVMNNNGARNAALRDGKTRAKWVLPWDGNCFLTENAWTDIVDGVTSRSYLKYFTVPMARLEDNAYLHDPAFALEPDSEPQILFRCDASEEFDERHYYGRRPKVELFYRLGIPGPWDRFYDDCWDLPRPQRSDEGGAVGRVGWVARLFSGQRQLEIEGQTGLRARGEARIEAVSGMLDRLSIEARKGIFHPKNLIFYDRQAIEALSQADAGTPEARIRERLITDADLALQRGPYSVTQKTTLAPSGNPHDYFHPAPYWWPNPDTYDGYPFVYRDGERVPGTRLYEAESDRYDRTRLEKLFHDTTVLALAWLADGRSDHATHAAHLIRTWFLDPATRMNPHLLYAQIRSQTPQDTGAASGLIEMKDLYYFLDAVRIIETSGQLSETEQSEFRAWLTEYLDWMQSSDQGQAEQRTRNNHGACYDLVQGSIAAFLGNAELLERTFFDSCQRILEQFKATGRQPHEMKRTQTAHYTCFNLQCWVNLATLAEACGYNLWDYEGNDGRGLARAFAWLLPHMGHTDWPYEQIEPFDPVRLLPLYHTAWRLAGEQVGNGHRINAHLAPATYFAHDGINPYWALGRRKAPSGTRSGSWSAVADELGQLSQTAADLCIAPPPAPVSVDATPEKLEAQLWTGPAQGALDELISLCNDPDTPDLQRGQAAHALARWAFAHGDRDEISAFADEMPEDTLAARRDKSLVQSWLCLQAGDVAAATAILDGIETIFSDDPDIGMARANARWHLDGATMQWSAALNRLYRQVGLPDFIEPANSERGWTTARPPRDEISADAPLVSVILTPPEESAVPEAAIQSLLRQSWSRLEILAVDRWADTDRSKELADVAQTDPRMRILKMAPATPEYAARNAALAVATGHYITRQGAQEIAHPSKIATQVEVMQSTACGATMVRQIFLTEDGVALPNWLSEFQYLEDNTASLLMETEALRAFQGWDAVPGDPDPVLLWRIDQHRLGRRKRIVSAGAPLSIQMSSKRDDLVQALLCTNRSIERIIARTTDEIEPDEALIWGDEPVIGALQQEWSAAEGQLDVLFVGDFSPDAPALAQIYSMISTALDADATVGLLHWSLVDANEAKRLDADISSLVDETGAVIVNAGATRAASRVVLCHPHLIHTRSERAALSVDTEIWEVLGGPELFAPAYDGNALSDRLSGAPTLLELEEALSARCEWVTI
ncbi:alginate lyase family protein [Gymnodinialimonas sp. 2305UL16-5]|uniref:alginate lyase family protein n=1 Tax=Gymnodinialimonas mytili TaxID=3126503 RepID=UPI0030A6421B